MEDNEVQQLIEKQKENEAERARKKKQEEDEQKKIQKEKDDLERKQKQEEEEKAIKEQLMELESKKSNPVPQSEGPSGQTPIEGKSGPDKPELEKDDDITQKKAVKVMLVGDTQAGKTSVMLRFSKNTFDDDYRGTLDISYSEMKVKMHHTMVNVKFLDSCTLKKKKDELVEKAATANVIIFVYSITQQDDFDVVTSFMDEIKDIRKTQDQIWVLCANKIDLPRDYRKVKTKDAEAYAKANDMIFGEVSCQTGKGVKELFTHDLFPKIIQKWNY